MHSTSTFGLSHLVYSGKTFFRDDILFFYINYSINNYNYRWCRDCTDLFIEVAYSEYSFYFGGDHSNEDSVIQLAHEELFPHLGWMTSLKSFIFIKRGKIHPFRDRFVSELTNWMFTQERATDSLQRLWIQEDSIEPYLSFPSITSLNLEHYRLHNLNQKKYRNLQHVSGIYFSRLANLPNLKYARGYCTNKKVYSILFLLIYIYLYFKLNVYLGAKQVLSEPSDA